MQKTSVGLQYQLFMYLQLQSTRWTYKQAPVLSPTDSCALGVEECDVRCMVCWRVSPVSDPRLIVLRRRPRWPADNPCGNAPLPVARSPKKRTIDGMTSTHQTCGITSREVRIEVNLLDKGVFFVTVIKQ